MVGCPAIHDPADNGSNVPNPDSCTAMSRCALKGIACTAVRVRSISRPKGNLASKPFRTPVEMRLGL
jgi:hypothetical protein